MVVLCYIKKEFLVLNKGSDVIVSIHDTTNNVLSSRSNYIVDVAMWLNFGSFSTFMREVIITQILCGFDQKNRLFSMGGLGTNSLI